jgi:glycosyltransferase involved in cell wall biosynthesis
MGVGSAMRAGLSYARRHGYDSAVRIDADGQHVPADIEQMLEPIRQSRADAVQGSRFLGSNAGVRHHSATVRAAQRGLALCLSMLTRARVTDPTSGFYAYGPRAMALLAHDHPTGYPEPEMRLMLSRNTLAVVEVPIESRPRQGGRTSLTAPRLVIAGGRVLLAMLIVPFRRDDRGGPRA